MALDDYTPNESSGDSLKPSEIVDHGLIVRVRQRKDGIVTQYTPEGGPGIIVDVVDLDHVDTATGVVGPRAFTDVLWMNGALVDNLTPNVGKTIAVKLVWSTGKSGRAYVSIEAAGDAEKARAATYLTANPDPWAQLADVTPITTAPTAAPAATPAAVTVPKDLTPEQIEQLKAMGVQVPA
jgi:hypothetical protein